LVEQVAVSVRLGVAEGKTLLPSCLGAMAECAGADDVLLKTVNLGVLMYTRSEDARLCLFALTCSEALWRAHGGKLLGELDVYL
jgi:U3 small nucleolar RNA-associated protein 10